LRKSSISRYFSDVGDFFQNIILGFLGGFLSAKNHEPSFSRELPGFWGPIFSRAFFPTLHSIAFQVPRHADFLFLSISPDGLLGLRDKQKSLPGDVLFHPRAGSSGYLKPNFKLFRYLSDFMNLKLSQRVAKFQNKIP
jgi:hypothetical protein